MSAFDEYRAQGTAYPYRYSGVLRVGIICGGIPSDPRVAEAWLRSRMGLDNDATLMAAVANTMAEREVTLDEATALVNEEKHLNGFKRERCENCTGPTICERKGVHQLFIEGRQLKAALKEAVSVAIAAGKVEQKGWGSTRKWLSTYFPEHVFVMETKLFLGVTEPSGVNQRFVHTHRGTGIQYEEYVNDAEITFTVESDHPFTEKDWAMIWLTGEKQGLGATRSQGYGTYTVEKWESIGKPIPKVRKAATKAAAAADEDEEQDELLTIDEIKALDEEISGRGAEPEEPPKVMVVATPKKMPARKVTPKKAVDKIPAIATI
jgi:hypothetical protein